MSWSKFRELSQKQRSHVALRAYNEIFAREAAEYIKRRPDGSGIEEELDFLRIWHLKLELGRGLLDYAWCKEPLRESDTDGASNNGERYLHLMAKHNEFVFGYEITYPNGGVRSVPGVFLKLSNYWGKTRLVVGFMALADKQSYSLSGKPVADFVRFVVEHDPTFTEDVLKKLMKNWKVWIDECFGETKK